jgi:hypothetical protein
MGWRKREGRNIAIIPIYGICHRKQHRKYKDRHTETLGQLP